MSDLINRTELLRHLDECIAMGDAQPPITNAVLTAIKCAVEQMPRADGIEWHKVTTRPLTEEEIAYYEEIAIEAEEIFDCEMPDDGQEILIATKWGVDKDICCSDPDYGIGLEGRGDWDGVLAWAEMPKYEEEKEKTNERFN